MAVLVASATFRPSFALRPPSALRIRQEASAARLSCCLKNFVCHSMSMNETAQMVFESMRCDVAHVTDGTRTAQQIVLDATDDACQIDGPNGHTRLKAKSLLHPRCGARTPVVLIVPTRQVGHGKGGATISVTCRASKDERARTRKAELLLQGTEAAVVTRVGLDADRAHTATPQRVAKCFIKEAVHRRLGIELWPVQLANLHAAVGANVEVGVLAP
eukprot:7238440-Prymnesium_polylepis.1